MQEPCLMDLHSRGKRVNVLLWLELQDGLCACCRQSNLLSKGIVSNPCLVQVHGPTVIAVINDSVGVMFFRWICFVRLVCALPTFQTMSGFVKALAALLINSALLLCLSLGLLVTACSNAGVALNSNPVELEPVSMDRADADQALVDSGSLDDAMLGSGL